MANNQHQATYFIEFIRGGDPDTELLRDLPFGAENEHVARVRARELLVEAGVNFGTLYRFRRGHTGPTDELGRVDVPRMTSTGNG